MSDVHDLPPDRRRRARMVRDQLTSCADDRIRTIMGELPRHWFVPTGAAAAAYDDSALAIGHGQTISQPRVVAYMLDQLQLAPGQRVLEVGAGSGYVTALLASLVAPDGAVTAIERQSSMVPLARRILAHCTGLASTEIFAGDGYAGKPEQAPFDRIHVACAAPTVPALLVDQLAINGRMIVPVGTDDSQHLLLITRDHHGRIDQQTLWPVVFVPMLDGIEDAS